MSGTKIRKAIGLNPSTHAPLGGNASESLASACFPAGAVLNTTDV
jgi:hypothetical protein